MQPLIEVSNLKEGYQDCPFCQRPKKFKVSGSSFKCFHPGCAKQGNSLDFLVLTGTDEKTAQSKVYESSDPKAWVDRCRFLEQAFAVYQTGVDSDTTSFLNQRGYDNCLNAPDIFYGHARGDNYLASRLPLQDCIKYRLAYPNGNDFFRDRIIFPIRDSKGRLVHLQGRATNPDEDLRWLSTPSKFGPEKTEQTTLPISRYLFDATRYHAKESIDWLFLAEGISDTLSLIELDAPAVGCFGVEIELVRFVSLFSKVKNLVVCLDNDKYALLTPKQNLYKSWTPMLPRLVELQAWLPNLNIWCLPPPNRPGIKDMNNWITEAALSKEAFADYLLKHRLSLMDFAIKSYGFQVEYHPHILKLLSLSREPAVDSEKFRNLMNLVNNDPVQYLLQLHPYF